MRRSGRINRGAWDWCQAKLLEVPGIAIAGIFIGVSGLMSVTFGFRLGEPSGNALIFAAVALAIEGFADLAVPLFWHRLGLIGRVVLIAFFGLCLCYKLEAAKRFAAENLGKRDAVTATAAQAYAVAEDDVKRLRKIIADNADARAADLLQAEIDGLLRDPKAEGCTGAINGNITKSVCPKVDALRAELARARSRDKAQAELKAAIATWRGATPATSVAQDSVGPVAALLALAGIQAGGWSQLIASLIMAIVEGGAIIVPMLIGAAASGSEPPREIGARPEPACARDDQNAVAATGASNPPETPAPVPPDVTERSRRDILELRAFLDAETEPAKGERIQSASFYLHYTAWKNDTSRRGYQPDEAPMHIVQFGRLLHKPIGLRKAKIEGRQYYLDRRLRHPAQGRKSAKQTRAVTA